MRKKVGLACALVHAPRVLVLDEPFEAVDPVSGTTIRALLQRFTAGGGTVVVSSHVMALVEQLCDHVAVIVAGRVVAAGTVADVRGEATLEERFVALSGGSRELGGGSVVVGVLVRLRLTLFHRQATRRGRAGPPARRRESWSRWASAEGSSRPWWRCGSPRSTSLVPSWWPWASLAVLAWALLPVLTSTDDVLIDPVRFALVPLPARTLAAGLLVATVVTPIGRRDRPGRRWRPR